MKKIYRFYVDMHRMGEIESVFIADEKKVNALIGKEIEFGEILGKHSDIILELKKEHLKIVTDDQEKIKIVESLNILPTGYCPFFYYTCVDCGEPLDPESENDTCRECIKLLYKKGE